MSVLFSRAYDPFLEIMVANFGAWGTIVICVGIVLLFFAWRLYNERRKDRTNDELLREKDRTIQRLADESRYYKIIVFKEVLKWTDERIDLLIIKNEHEDVVSARKALEGEGTTDAKKTLKPAPANKKEPKKRR